MKSLFIVAGDPSGDMIASRLVTALKNIHKDLQVTGVGGKEIEKVSDRFLANIVDQGAFGLPVSPKQISFFRDILNKVIINDLKNNPPDAVIPVDFYGFNSLVASAAKTQGLKVFYYATPQFWATRPGRAETLRKSVDLFLCLFPFEIEFYRKRNLPVQFVGHPLLDSLPSLPERPTRIENIIGLLPGSRVEEIKRHLPIMMGACNIISSEARGTRFILFTMKHIPRQLYHDLIAKHGSHSQCLIELVEDADYQWRSQIDLAITASGMETLENALLGIPMVIMYKTNWITYLAARMLIQVPYIGMPNLLAGEKLVPEFIQWKATAERVAEPIVHWIKNPAQMKQLKSQLLDLKKQFGECGASERAARAILEKVA